MEVVIFITSFGAIIVLFIALFEISHIKNLEKQVKQSYEILPLNTSLSEIAPDIGYIFPNIIPLTQTTIHLGRRPQRMTIHVPNCPECGKFLRAIDGKYGRFWGCNGYPNCHYTRKYT